MKSFLVKPLAMPVWVVAVLTVGSMVCGIAIGASGATDKVWGARSFLQNG